MVADYLHLSCSEPEPGVALSGDVCSGEITDLLLNDSEGDCTLSALQARHLKML